MNKIIDYKIVRRDTHAGLIELVNDAITQGWQPYEQPFFAGPLLTEHNPMFYQALVKYE